MRQAIFFFSVLAAVVAAWYYPHVVFSHGGVAWAASEAVGRLNGRLLGALDTILPTSIWWKIDPAWTAGAIVGLAVFLILFVSSRAAVTLFSHALRRKPTAATEETASQMNLFRFLFSFNGRISRLPYWLFSIATIPIGLAEFIYSSVGEETHIYVFIIFFIFFSWVSLAVQAKRWHDRNKSGWWILINFVPLIGPIWSLIENGFLSGTAGSNWYGADPLHRGGTR